MKNTTLGIALVMIAQFIHAQNEVTTTTPRPDSHAPIGVMADHTHGKGGIMLSYRYMTMDMAGLQEEDNNITNAIAFEGYMIAAQQMTMGMHMLGAMYAPTDKLTLMAMGTHVTNTMELEARNGTAFSTASGAFGDVSLSGLYQFFKKEKTSMHAQLGVSIPTGSIEEMDITPMSMGNEVQLPYPMQTGTGSLGVIAGATFLWKSKKLSGGIQAKGTFYLQENDQDYTFGNRYGGTTWVATVINPSISISLRGEAKLVDKIKGQSPLLNPMMVNTAAVENSGGMYANIGFGLNFILPYSIRMATEMVVPAYQKLNGIQLEQNYGWTMGLQYAFK